MLTRSEVRAAERAGLSRKQILAIAREASAEEAKNKNPRIAPGTVMRDGLAMEVVDPTHLAALKEVARLSVLLLEYTERGGAAAALPHHFVTLAETLRSLAPLLRSEPGTGEVVSELMQLLDSLEE